MARINRVKKAAKDQRKCGVCGKPIVAGDAYKWVKPRFGSKQVRCTSCPDWRRSELTTSKLANAYAAQEQFEDITDFTEYETVDAWEMLAEALGDQIEECAEEYEESASNIEDGFGHEVPMSEELREKADMVREWADEVRQAVSNVDPYDEADAIAEVKEELADELEGLDEDEREEMIGEAVAEKYTTWLDEMAEAISEALCNEPF